MSRDSLLRSLGFKETASLVVGTVIGTGVFLKAAGMAQLVGSASWVLIAWAAAGLLSFAGALCYAELGGRFPSAGGEYVFLREAYGEIAAFTYGWMRFWIGSPGSIAAYSVGAATFLAEPLGLATGAARAALATVVIVLFSALNCISVAFGGRVQEALTALKMALIIGLSAAIFAFASGGSWAHLLVPGADGATLAWLGPWPGWSAFGTAMIAALWAYDGWNNMPMAAGEVKNPERNIPLALGAGMAAVIAIYGFANLSYFYALTFPEVAHSNSAAFPNELPLATRAAGSAFGAAAATIFSVAFAVSAIGALNGSILTCARVPFAMARDGAFFRRLGEVSARRTPVAAIVTQAVVSIALALSGTFDQITDCVIVASWAFYALAAGSLFLFRRRDKAAPPAEISFRAPFFPLLPIAFILCALALIGNALVELPFASGVGAAFTLSGIPVAIWFRRARRAQS